MCVGAAKDHGPQRRHTDGDQAHRGEVEAELFSIRHADFMSDFFCRAGIRAVAVHSGPRSARRTASLERLERGEIDILFAVYDSGDGVLDSTTVVDRFRWIAEPGVPVSTDPIPK